MAQIGPQELNAPLSKTNLQTTDPTELTTRSVDRAVSQLIALFEQRFKAIEEKADRTLQLIDARPAAVVIELEHLHTLTDEKFKGVDQQFAGRDTALAAALLAQKTSVEEQNKSNALAAAKSEAATTKQIDSIQTLLAAQAKAFEDKVSDVKERVLAIEGHSRGIGDSWGWLVGGAGLVAAIISIAFKFGGT